MIDEDGLNAADGVLHLVDDLKQVLGRRGIRSIDDVRKLSVVNGGEILESGMQDLESWVVGLDRVGDDARVDVPFDKCSKLAPDLIESDLKILNGLFDCDGTWCSHLRIEENGGHDVVQVGTFRSVWCDSLAHDLSLKNVDDSTSQVLSGAFHNQHNEPTQLCMRQY